MNGLDLSNHCSSAPVVLNVYTSLFYNLRIAKVSHQLFAKLVVNEIFFSIPLGHTYFMYSTSFGNSSLVSISNYNLLWPCHGLIPFVRLHILSSNSL